MTRGFDGWVACLLFHVILESPPGRQKGGWVGSSCRVADSGDGKRGKKPDVVQWVM
jgi:hypothetical protein